MITMTLILDDDNSDSVVKALRNPLVGVNFNTRSKTYLFGFQFVIFGYRCINEHLPLAFSLFSYRF